MEGNIMSTNQLMYIERELNRFMRRKEVIHFMRLINMEENCIHFDTIREKLQKNAYKNSQECLNEIFSIFLYCYEHFRPGAMIRSTARDFERQFTINLEGMPPEEVAVRNPIRLPRPKLAPKYNNILPKRRMEDDKSLQRKSVEETIMELDESPDEKLNLEKEMVQLYISQKKLSDLLPVVLNDFNQLTTVINRIRAMTPVWHGETPTPEYEYEDEQQANDGQSFGLPELRASVNHLFQTQREYSNLIDYFKSSLDAVNALLNQVRERINQTSEDDSQLMDETPARSPIKMRIKVTQKRSDDGSVSKSYEVIQNDEKNKSLKEPN